MARSKRSDLLTIGNKEDELIGMLQPGSIVSFLATMPLVDVTARLAEACVLCSSVFVFSEPRRAHAGRRGCYPGHGGGAWGAAASGEGGHLEVVFRGLDPTVELERGQTARRVERFHNVQHIRSSDPHFTI